MASINASHIIAGLQKTHPRLYEALNIIINDIEQLKIVLGRGVAGTVSPATLNTKNRRTFAEVARNSVGVQNNLTSAGKGNLETDKASVGGSGGGSSNILKRISVRI